MRFRPGLDLAVDQHNPVDFNPSFGDSHSWNGDVQTRMKGTTTSPQNIVRTWNDGPPG